MDEAAAAPFEATVLPHLDDAYTLARYLVRDAHLAQDVVQDAALRALRHFAGFRQGDARAWFLAIVRNCAFTALEASRTRAERHGDHSLALEVESPGAADDLAVRNSEMERVRTALGALPGELREVVVLRELGDLSYREISDITGAPMGTVMSRLSRARDRLAKLLAPGREGSR